MVNYSKQATKPGEYLPHSLTITGLTGVGTSSALKALQEELGSLLWRYVSGGSLMRETAAGLGMTIDELTAHNLQHPEAGIDHECDQKLRELGRHDYFVLESRLGHFLVPHACHVLLKCGLRTRVERRQKQEGYTHHSRSEVATLIKNRDRNDHHRYQKLYPGYRWPEADYDLVIDTTKYRPREIAKLIKRGHSKWVHRLQKKGLIGQQISLSPNT